MRRLRAFTSSAGSSTSDPSNRIEPLVASSRRCSSAAACSCRAGRPDQEDELARSDIDVDALENLEAPELLRHVANPQERLDARRLGCRTGSRIGRTARRSACQPSARRRVGRGIVVRHARNAVARVDRDGDRIGRGLDAEPLLVKRRDGAVGLQAFEGWSRSLRSATSSFRRAIDQTKPVLCSSESWI